MPAPFEPYTDMTRPGIYKSHPDQPGQVILPDNFDTYAEVENDKTDVRMVPSADGKRTRVYFHRRV